LDLETFKHIKIIAILNTVMGSSDKIRTSWPEYISI